MQTAERIVTVVLPKAPPDAYLRWIAWWRRVEQAMLERPALARLVASTNEAFLRGPVAEFFSGRLLRDIHAKATAAQRQGQASVTPRVTGTHGLLAGVADHVQRWAEWMDWALEQDRVSRYMDVPPLTGRLRALRDRVVHAIGEQLAGNTDEVDRPGSRGALSCPACGSEDLLTITMTIRDAPIAFTFCGDCEWRGWEREGRMMPLAAMRPYMEAG
jgi:hypothetical protein